MSMSCVEMSSLRFLDRTAIAHSIREQVQIYQKSLFLVGHPSDGSAVQDDDLRMSLLPSLTTGARAIDQVSALRPSSTI